jgi:hypothetical protein
MHYCVHCGVRVEDPTLPGCPHCGAARPAADPAATGTPGAYVRVGSTRLPRWLPWTLLAVLAAGGTTLGVAVAHRSDSTSVDSSPGLPVLPGDPYGTPSTSGDGSGTSYPYSDDGVGAGAGDPATDTPTPAEDTEEAGTTGTTGDTGETETASTVVTDYYDHLNAGNYSAAWDMGGSNLSGGSYSDWVAGFGTTSHVYVTAVDDGSGSGSGVVEVDLQAVQTDGSVQTFSGTYTVQDGEITSADIDQAS